MRSSENKLCASVHTSETQLNKQHSNTALAAPRSFFEREGIGDDILDLEYKKITQNPNGDSDVTVAW